VFCQTSEDLKRSRALEHCGRRSLEKGIVWSSLFARIMPKGQNKISRTKYGRHVDVTTTDDTRELMATQECEFRVEGKPQFLMFIASGCHIRDNFRALQKTKVKKIPEASARCEKQHVCPKSNSGRQWPKQNNFITYSTKTAVSNDSVKQTSSRSRPIHSCKHRRNRREKEDLAFQKNCTKALWDLSPIPTEQRKNPRFSRTGMERPVQQSKHHRLRPGRGKI
jgi:hypothetical protein